MSYFKYCQCCGCPIASDSKYSFCSDCSVFFEDLNEPMNLPLNGPPVEIIRTPPETLAQKNQEDIDKLMEDWGFDYDY